MKATELQIGDWVLFNVSPAQINGISEDMGSRCIRTNKTDVWCSETVIDPIPLTAEILKKNGFDKCGDETTFTCNDDKWAIAFVIVDGGCPILTIEEVSQHFEHNLLNLRDEIYNVHELQHALRLCGIEKEIQL